MSDADPIAVLREALEFARLYGECPDGKAVLALAQVEALLKDRDSLREFVAHTLDEYGERMPNQWKAHARARLADASGS